MKKGWIGAICVSLLSGCSSIQKAPPPMASHAYLPTKFYVSYWAFMYPGYTKIDLENGYLVRRQVGEKKEVLKTEYFTPSESDWRKFWTKMNELGWTRWKAEYSPQDIGSWVDDGGAWTMEVEYRGTRVESRGENAGPMRGNPRKTVLWYDQVNETYEILLVPAPENR